MHCVCSQTLSYITDQSHHHAHHPLPLWKHTHQEVSSGMLLRWEAVRAIHDRWSPAAGAHPREL